MELVFDSRTGRVMLKIDGADGIPTIAEKISTLHKNGHYLPHRDRMTKTLKKTIETKKAKYNYKPIRCTYGSTNIALDFKSIEECATYFNRPLNTVKYHLYHNTEFLGWKIQFRDRILNKETADDQR